MINRFLTICLILVTAAISFSISANAANERPPPIKLGILMPLTGEFAMPAAAFREGIELATGLINSTGGINGASLEVIIEDTQSNPKAIGAAASKLVNVDRIAAAITTSYPETEIGGGIFQQARIPSLALWDSSPQIDQMGEYIFAIGPWTPSDAEVSSRFAIEKLKARKAVIVNTVEHWSELVADLFEKEFIRQGGSIVGRFRQNPGDSDFRSVLTKIRTLGSDVIYAPLASEILPFHKQRRSAALSIPVISSGVISDEHVALAPGDLEGVFQSQISDPNRSETKELAKLYKKKFNRALSMDWYVSTGFDAINLYVQALKAVGPDSVKLKDYLYTIKDFPGTAQNISISAGGSSPYFVKMFQIEDAKFKVIS